MNRIVLNRGQFTYGLPMSVTALEATQGARPSPMTKWPGCAMSPT